MRVADDAIGIDEATAGDGMGLRIMRYRASSIGGRLTAQRGANRGTVVACTIRLEQEGRPGQRRASIKTIETYRSNIKTKLHLKDATDLIRFATTWVTRL